MSRSELPSRRRKLQIDLTITWKHLLSRISMRSRWRSYALLFPLWAIIGSNISHLDSMKRNVPPTTINFWTSEDYRYISITKSTRDHVPHYPLLPSDLGYIDSLNSLVNAVKHARSKARVSRERVHPKQSLEARNRSNLILFSYYT
ncbi:hypothetical protein BDZ45DRAFT_385887 [Acephala macrosclerotiorum]|nr:hypothetical protein BDZ45DRAFT_385887 [Acephala macrosclerotiorum]